MTNVFEEQDPITPEEQESITPQEQEPVTPQPINMKDLSPEEQMKKIKEETLRRLYQDDPLIREGIDAQLAIEASRAKAAPKESPFEYDAEGNLVGVKSSHKGKVSSYELIKEIRKNTERKFGGEQ